MSTQYGLPAYKADILNDEGTIEGTATRPPNEPSEPDLSSCSVEWLQDIQMGTAQDDEAASIAIDAARNIYLGGYLGGRVRATNIDPSGDSSAFLAKYLPTGALRWTREVDTPGTDVAEAVRIHPIDKHLVMLGRTSDALPGQVNAGQFDLFLQIFSRDGTALQAFQYGDEGPQHPRNLAFSSAGDAYAEGFNDVWVVDRTVWRREDEIVMTFAYKGDGQFEPKPTWATTATSMAPDYGTGLAAPAGGMKSVYTANATIVGSSLQMKDSDGNTIWTKKINAFSPDQITAVAIDSTGDAVVVGSTSERLGSRQFGLQDVYVAKVDQKNGDLLWVTQIGTPVGDWPTALSINAQGQIFVVGRSTGSFVPGYATASPLDADLFALRLGADGTLQNVWQRGSWGAEDVPTAVAVDVCGNVLIAGYTSGTLVPGAVSQGGRDVFLLRIKPEEWKTQ